MNQFGKRACGLAMAAGLLVPATGCTAKPEFAPYDMSTSQALAFQDRATYCRVSTAGQLDAAQFEGWNQPGSDGVAIQVGTLATGGKIELDVVTECSRTVTIKTTVGTLATVLIVAVPGLQSFDKESIASQIRSDGKVVGGAGFYVDSGKPGRLQIGPNKTFDEVISDLC